MTVFIYEGRGPKMFLKPVPKGPLKFPNVLLFTACLGTVKPIYYPTLLGDGVPYPWEQPEGYEWYCFP